MADRYTLRRRARTREFLQQRRGGDQRTVQRQDASTYGLNAANQELAEIGTPIPVLFGKRTEEGTGGFVHAPSMIYQRMHSAGEYEWTRLGFVCGEGGTLLNKPLEGGIRLGTDLIKSKQSSFYDLRFTTGATADNDLNISNSTAYGTWRDLPSTITSGNDFFTIQQSLEQVRGLSQSYEPNENFGLAGEPPDCETSSDPDFELLLPYPNDKSTHVEYNQINASVANTRKCAATEFGFQVNLPLPSLLSEESDIPIGSKWRYSKKRVGANENKIILVTGAGRNPFSNLPIITGYSPAETWEDGTRIQIISPEIAFYTVYRKFYENNNLADIAEEYARFLRSWGNGSRVFYITLDDIPSFIYTASRRFFNINTEDDEYENLVNYWERIDASWRPSVNNQGGGPCELQLSNELIKDTRVPKLFFELFYRKIDSKSDNWEPVLTTPLCFTNPNAADIYAAIKVIHPTDKESAFEYKFKPLLPVQADAFNADYMTIDVIVKKDDTGRTLRSGKYGAASTTNNRLPVLFPGTGNEYIVSGNDGFKIIYEGYYEAVPTEIAQNDQVPNYTIGVSYVNECVIDTDTTYPHMAIGALTLRAGKGVSSASQLSFYYDNGAEVTKADGTTGASNQFADLCYHALTYYPGAQGPISRNQIDIDSFIAANQFCGSRKLFYDGVLSDSSGVHEFIAEHAKYFLHRFGMNQGKYALFPAFKDSKTNTNVAEASQTITTDILDPGSFEIDYATLAERDAAFMTVIWRFQEQMMPGIKETVTVRPQGYEGPNKLTYDLSGFCTSKEHAIAVARFLLDSRMQQDQVVTFTCSKSGVDLTPGRLFKFDLSIETSAGATYTNTDQYQVTSATYREDGLLDIRAIYMASLMYRRIFTAETYPEVD